MSEPIQYTYYMITRPTRSSRRPANFEVFATKTEAKLFYVSQFPLFRAGEREWRRRREQDGWAIEPVTVSLDAHTCPPPEA